LRVPFAVSYISFAMSLRILSTSGEDFNGRPGCAIMKCKLGCRHVT
jgi:hypothetical protein